MLFLTNEIGGSISIGDQLSSDTENLTNPTIKPTIFYSKQATGPGHSDWNHLPIGILNTGIDVPIYRQNIDNHTDMNPQGPISTTVLESNRAHNFDIFNLVSRTSDLAYRGFPWHVTTKIKVKILEATNFSKMLSLDLILKLKKLSAKIL